MGAQLLLHALPMLVEELERSMALAGDMLESKRVLELDELARLYSD